MWSSKKQWAHKKNLLPACILSIKRQEFLNGQSARNSISPNHQGTHKMTEDVLSSARPQDLDTGGYKISDLDDADFFWEKPPLELVAVFKTKTDTPFRPQRLFVWIAKVKT